MIDRWRYVTSTGDGCAVYECLACRGRWEARGLYAEAFWSYCPHCGIRWEGEQADRSEERKRFRNEAAWHSQEIRRSIHRVTVEFQTRSFWIHYDGSEELVRDWGEAGIWKMTLENGARNALESYRHFQTSEVRNLARRDDCLPFRDEVRFVFRYPDDRVVVPRCFRDGMLMGSSGRRYRCGTTRFIRCSC